MAKRSSLQDAELHDQQELLESKKRKLCSCRCTISVKLLKQIINEWNIFSSQENDCNLCITLFNNGDDRDTNHFYIYWIDKDSVVIFMYASAMFLNHENTINHTFYISGKEFSKYLETFLSRVSSGDAVISVDADDSVRSWNISTSTSSVGCKFPFFPSSSFDDEGKVRPPYYFNYQLTPDFYCFQNMSEIITTCTKNSDILSTTSMVRLDILDVEEEAYSTRNFVRLRFFQNEDMQSPYIEFGPKGKSLFSTLFSASKWLSACEAFKTSPLNEVWFVSHEGQLFELRYTCSDWTQRVMLAKVCPAEEIQIID